MGNPVVHFEVVGNDAILARIERLGGRKALGPTNVPGGPSIAMFTDPEGHLVGLVKAGTTDPQPH